jgi:hypothetical protein
MLRSVRSTSPGTDGLPCWFFQSCSVELADIVCHIFNYFITSGIVLSQWSTALVTLIPKVTNPRQLGEFRPISVTPILSRLVEKFITHIHGSGQLFLPRLLLTSLRSGRLIAPRLH